MQFVVETASVADWVAILVASPQGGGGRSAVRTVRTSSARGRLQNKHNHPLTTAKCCENKKTRHTAGWTWGGRGRQQPLTTMLDNFQNSMCFMRLHEPKRKNKINPGKEHISQWSVVVHVWGVVVLLPAV